MNKSEVIKVITEMNVVDPRVEPVTSPHDPRIGLFYDVLQEFPYHQAEAAVREYASESHMVVMQVGHVAERIRGIRRRNLEQVQIADLVPPDGLAPGQYPEWAQLARMAVMDGAPDAAAASEWADSEMVRLAEKAKKELSIERRELGAPRGPLQVSQIRGQARMDVVAGELLVTETGEGEL